MKMWLAKDAGRSPLTQLSYAQTKQAMAVMDCIGRLIPQEGVDYDVEITFKGPNDPSVSLVIVALTDKGEKWKSYVEEMIRKYPPTVDFNGDVLPDSPEVSNEGDRK